MLYGVRTYHIAPARKPMGKFKETLIIGLCMLAVLLVGMAIYG